MALNPYTPPPKVDGPESRASVRDYPRPRHGQVLDLPAVVVPGRTTPRPRTAELTQPPRRAGSAPPLG